MIRHGYTSCATCHADPSGGGIITAYGRAQSELLLAQRLGKQNDDGEVSPRTNFLFGAVSLPEWLNLAAAFRGGGMYNLVGATGEDPRSSANPLLMVADVRGHVRAGIVTAGATIGYAPRRALLAALTRGNENNVISREHWAGVSVLEDSLVVRAGRVHLPFGLRSIEHNTWVREQTRSDINEHQQHGVAAAFNTQKIRSELMLIAGNFQLKPDEYRERGYSAYAEYSVAPRAAAGVSSLITRATYDIATRERNYLRQAHGVFGRYAPIEPLVLQLEGDLLLDKPDTTRGEVGYAAMLQADYQFIQGVRGILTGEALQRRGVNGLGGWVSASWQFLPQAELRVDAILRKRESGGLRSDTLTVLGQLFFAL
jgi:hypothetical protein